MLDKFKNIKPRENAGSDTFKNYDYQYHWAIYTLLDESKHNEDIAVLIEFHEDVILVKDLKNQEKLHFFQIKANEKQLSIKDITRKEKGTQLSILEKLSLNNDYIDLFDNIEAIKLVGAKGFKFTTTETDFSALSDADKSEIEQSIITEYDKSIFLDKLSFLPSKLPKENFEQTVKGIIAETVDRLYPNKKCQVNAIYLIIKDDLYDKGKRKVINISDPINEKGITFSKIKEIIEINTDTNDENYSLALDMIKDTDFNNIKKAQIINELNKYKTHHLMANTIQSEIKLDIVNSDLISNVINSKENKINDIINKFCVKTSEKYDNIGYMNLILAGVYYELSRYIREAT